jgi:hypothetical protein
MATFTTGQRVQINLTGLHPIASQNYITPGIILGPGPSPGTYNIKVDAALNCQDRFTVTADRLS